jgi:polyisoprenoid-binding protein YceI
VTTGTAGLLSFAGHRHLIAAREFDGTIVHRLDVPTASTVTIRILTRSLEVLTPPDTAEIRKVSATMRDEVLHTEQHPEITLTTRAATPTAGGFHLVALLTIAGRTREVPIDVSAVVGADTLRGTASFSVKQTDFGLTPYRGGPGGTVRVADVITFHIDLVGARVP